MKKLILIALIFICKESISQTIKDCSTCSNQIINNLQIKDLSIDDIRYLTNDLYARKGYKFKDSNIDSFYSEKNWYKPINDNSKIIFNSTEQKNIKLFQQKTTELKTERKNLINELINFKSIVLQNKVEILNSKYEFNLDLSKDNEIQSFNYFKEVIDEIKVENINWIKNIGFYKVTIDNLNETISYQIKIDSKHISFRYNYDSGSEAIYDDLYPNEYSTEFTYNWEFEFNKNNLKFVELVVAG